MPERFLGSAVFMQFRYKIRAGNVEEAASGEWEDEVEEKRRFTSEKEADNCTKNCNKRGEEVEEKGFFSAEAGINEHAKVGEFLREFVNDYGKSCGDTGRNTDKIAAGNN